MRKVYDTAVADWQQKAVAYHRYAQYGVIFDRHVSWADKRGAVAGRRVKRDAVLDTPDSSVGIPSRGLREDTVCGTGKPENNGNAGIGIDMNIGDPLNHRVQRVR